MSQLSDEETNLIDPENSEIKFTREEVFNKWKRKRKITTILFYLSGILLGLEYSAVVISLWFFLKDTIQVNHAPFYYSIGMTSMALSAILASVTLGRYIDKSRNIRRFMMTLNVLNACGNIIYSLNFSVWFPIFGRLICGVSDSLNGAISGELSRAYSPDELAAVLSRYQAFFSIGFVIGPATSIMFEKVDFYIGTWHLNNTNFIGVFLAILTTLFNIVVFLGVTNLYEYDWTEICEENETTTETFRFSRENVNQYHNVQYGSFEQEDHKYDQNSQLDEVDNNEEQREKKKLEVEEFNPKGIAKIGPLLSFKDVLKNPRMLLINVSAAFLCYVSVTVELLIPLVCTQYFNWSQWKISLIITICVIVIFPCIPIVLKKKSRTYPLYVVSLFLIAVAPALLIIPTVTPLKSGVVQICIISIVILTNSLSGIQSMALSRSLILYISPSHSASFAEGIRLAFARSFALVGFFNAGLILPHIKYASPVIIAMSIGFGALLYICRRRY